VFTPSIFSCSRS